MNARHFAPLFRAPISNVTRFAVLAFASLSILQAAAPLDRIFELRREIAHHDALYFEHAKPEISDSEYDALKRELVRLEEVAYDDQVAAPEQPAIYDDGSKGFTRFTHRQPMLSLDKAHSKADLLTFFERVKRLLPADSAAPDFVVEPKYDGVALSVTYENGVLTHAVTRGNGLEGDDVTANARAIRNLPHRLHDGRGSVPKLIELRGEVFINTADFDQLNEERPGQEKQQYASPRNLAAGTLKQHDPALVAARRLQIVFYTFGEVAPASVLPPTQHALHAQLRAWGLPAIERKLLVCKMDEVWGEALKLGSERYDLAFPIDGAVVKLDSIALQRALGASRTAPRWAVAYKFAPSNAETVLKNITLQVGRSGVITPVAELAPVQLAGATLSRASLHNVYDVVGRDLRVGDTVIVERAGEVIPMIVGVNLARRPADSTSFSIPSVCPSCSSLLQRRGESDLFCVNEHCPARLERRLELFVSRAGVGIRGLGPKTIHHLVSSGRLKGIPDIYRLERADFSDGSDTQNRSADRQLAAIEASKHAELWRVITGLGIDFDGPRAAKKMAATYGSLAAIASASRESLLKWSEYAGKEMSEYLGNAENQKLLQDLDALGIGSAPQIKSLPPPITSLSGKRVAIAGILPTLGHYEATEILEAAGARVEKLDSRTDLVVAGEGAGASLLLRSRAHRVRVIDESELIRLAGPLESED
jgi:DNA ligase (NAD+)